MGAERRRVERVDATRREDGELETIDATPHPASARAVARSTSGCLWRSKVRFPQHFASAQLPRTSSLGLATLARHSGTTEHSRTNLVCGSRVRRQLCEADGPNR